MTIKTGLSVIIAGIFMLMGCKTEKSPSKNTEVNANGPNNTLQKEVQTFLDTYTQEYVRLYTAASEAQWKSNTYIVEGDQETGKLAQQADEAFAKFTGSKKNSEQAQEFLKNEAELKPVQIRQLKAILYQAANNPEIATDLVSKRIEAENAQNATLFGYTFKVNGKEVSTGDIDEKLKTSTDLNERLEYWEASKEVGKKLKDGLENLKNLRNQTVQALGYNDYYYYQVSDYGMTREEMQKLNDQMIRDIWSLYRELHTYMRYKLAEKYNTDVPDMLPAHWLPNRWGQDWSSEIDVKGLDLTSALKDKSAEWIVKEGENFYKSIGFDALPQSFYEKGSMYPLPKDSNHKKNNHASAWHMNLENDVRCLMSVTPTPEYYETVHHELGHIYYYLTYTNPDVPPLLRGGANRAFHEGVGSLLGLAAMQKPFLAERGLVDKETKTDKMQILLKEAMNYIVFLPFSAGVMNRFEHELYANNLLKDEFNKKWWELKEKYQGIAPPTERGEEYCDATAKTHINNDAAQYYDYAISYILLFQLHDHIAKKILKQDPHATNYYGNKEVGDFLRKILRPGANCDWRELLKENVGSDMSAKPMLEYFEPLMDYLKEKNKNHQYTLPESI
ncbi:MAG: M2 family metallopeptidase [Flavobacteriales bacterium]